MSTLKLCMMGAAIAAFSATVSATELRLDDATMDRVTAGVTIVPGADLFTNPGFQDNSIGPNPTVTPFPGTTFGGFDLLDGPLTPPPPQPEPPIVTPPIGGGGGSPIQQILALLLGLSGIPR